MTLFGVEMARSRPWRPSGIERDAERRAPSARMPTAASASSTVRAVVQYGVGHAVDGHREGPGEPDDDLLAVLDVGVQRRGHDVAAGSTVDVLVREQALDGVGVGVDGAALTVDEEGDGLAGVGVGGGSADHGAKGDGACAVTRAARPFRNSSTMLQTSFSPGTARRARRGPPAGRVLSLPSAAPSGAAAGGTALRVIRSRLSAPHRNH